MHFDLIHALIVVAALVGTNIALSASGILGDEDKNRWSWKRFLAYFVVVFVINLIWPI
ncbi:hypothetical protein CLV78_107203 [Aliiruegeria haliotis]|uniref:Uncharacterized protein n=1 Tax=Aliiruegeria haliotis TaxID=1280846 RepID=A0A2T0RM60_9RHOB|nr:hypothetical protein [Aliiruegeria haliotis]PRY22279.1 hypothetical protein CLV78_107203 [Aliiruegeria haliotis]